MSKFLNLIVMVDTNPDSMCSDCMVPSTCNWFSHAASNNTVCTCTVVWLAYAGCWHNSVKEVEEKWLPAGISVELSTQPLYLGLVIWHKYFFVGSIVSCLKEVDQSYFHPTDNISVWGNAVSGGGNLPGWWQEIYVFRWMRNGWIGGCVNGQVDGVCEWMSRP